MDKKGWILTELVVIIVVLGIVCGFAIPAYRNQIRRANLKSAREDIISTLRLAQVRATSERVIYRVNFNSGDSTYQIGNDPDGDGTFAYEAIQTLPQGISFVTTSTYFEFLPDRTINIPFSDVIITNGSGSVRFFVTGGTGYKIEVAGTI